GQLQSCPGAREIELQLVGTRRCDLRGRFVHVELERIGSTARHGRRRVRVEETRSGGGTEERRPRRERAHNRGALVGAGDIDRDGGRVALLWVEFGGVDEWR